MRKKTMKNQQKSIIIKKYNLPNCYLNELSLANFFIYHRPLFRDLHTASQISEFSREIACPRAGRSVFACSKAKSSTVIIIIIAPLLLCGWRTQRARLFNAFDFFPIFSLYAVKERDGKKQRKKGKKLCAVLRFIISDFTCICRCFASEASTCRLFPPSFLLFDGPLLCVEFLSFLSVCLIFASF